MLTRPLQLPTVVIAPSWVGGGSLSETNASIGEGVLSSATAQMELDTPVPYQTEQLFAGGVVGSTATADQNEAPYLKSLLLAREMVVPLARRAGLRRTPIITVDPRDMDVNAELLSGIDTIVITRGALETLDPRLLNSLLAHEIGHNHFYRRAIFKTCGIPLGAALSVSVPLSTLIPATSAVTCFLAIFLPVAIFKALTIYAWEEIAADRKAIEITGDPASQIDLLHRFGSGDSMIPVRIEHIEALKDKSANNSILKKPWAIRLKASFQEILHHFRR